MLSRKQPSSSCSTAANDQQSCEHLAPVSLPSAPGDCHLKTRPLTAVWGTLAPLTPGRKYKFNIFIHQDMIRVKTDSSTSAILTQISYLFIKFTNNNVSFRIASIIFCIKDPSQTYKINKASALLWHWI